MVTVRHVARTSRSERRGNEHGYNGKQDVPDTAHGGY